jgi:hypothetical protein
MKFKEAISKKALEEFGAMGKLIKKVKLNNQKNLNIKIRN